MTNEELLAKLDASEADVAATTITFRDWLRRIRQNRNYAYETTEWYQALDRLTQPDKATLLAVIDAAQRDLSTAPEPPPTGDFAWLPATPKVGEEVTFTVTDPDPDYSYGWDFNLDGIADQLGQTAKFTYQGVGTKTVQLLVGLTVVRTRSFAVAPAEPPPPTGDVLRHGISFGGIGDTADSARRGRMMDDVLAVGGVSLRIQWWRQQQTYDAVHQAVGKGLRVINTVMPDFSNTVHTRSSAKAIGIEWANLLGDVVKDAAFWNEPDLTSTWTPELWAEATLGFMEGIEASQHPDVRVWVGELWTWRMNSGSMTEGAAEWWRRAYLRWKALGLTGLPGHGCSGHMYGDTSWQDVRNAIFGYFGSDLNGGGQLNVRTLMDQNGDADKPIIATECGSNAGGQTQVNAVNSMFDLYEAGKLAAFTVYSMWDDAAGTFGLRPAEGVTPRPAYTTYQQRIAALGIASIEALLAAEALAELAYVGDEHQPQSPTEIRLRQGIRTPVPA